MDDIWTFVGYFIGAMLMGLVVFLWTKIKTKVMGKINEKKEENRIAEIKQQQIERNKREEEELQRKREEQAKILAERKGPDWFCPKCAVLNPGHGRYCMKCGYKREE